MSKNAFRILTRASRFALALLLTASVCLPALGQTNMTYGLVGWWPMNEGSGATLNDMSGNGNTGTLYNSPTWIAGYQPGMNALSFTNGNSSYVEIPDSASLRLGTSGSISFWAQFPNFPSTPQGIICKGDCVSSKYCYGWYYGLLAPYYYFDIAGSSGHGQFFNNVSWNTWVFFCTTWNTSGNMVMYANAIPMSTGAVTRTPATAGYPLRFGANGASVAGNFFTGVIADVRIYNRQISPNDVSYLYTSGGGAPWFLPDGYLASIPKPYFPPGNHFPHLTRWGWSLSSNACVELARDWDFCLPLSNAATPEIASNTSIAGTFDWGMANLARTNSNYKLSVIIDRTFTNPPPNGFWCTNSAGMFVDAQSNSWPVNAYNNGAYYCSTSTSPTFTFYEPMVCPEGDLNGAASYWTNITAYWLNSLLMIQSNGPIATIMNGGEYALQVPGWGQTAWDQDPRVQAAAVMTNPFSTNANYLNANTNGMSWLQYCSFSKARQLGYLTTAIKQKFPNRELSIFYNTANEQNYSYWKAQTNPYWLQMLDDWGWWSLYMNTNTDLPSFESYYPQDGYWTNSWTQDLLTHYLNGLGFDFNIGYTNTYSWVCGGYSTTSTNALSDMGEYTGFLKCLYTAGMRGAIAGYFCYPPGGQGWLVGGPGFDAPFPSNSPPHWLQQIVQLSQVHAQFCQLEAVLTNSDLLSGPQLNAMNYTQPAWEFTNTVADANARVLARKVRGTSEWLITAWAAAGTDRNVTVNIPALGAVTVLARNCGSVYQATTPTSLKLLDTDGMHPGSIQPPVLLGGRPGP